LEVVTVVAETEPRAAEEGRRAGLLWGCGAYLLWGLATVYWKQLKHYDAFELIGYRICSSALLMGTYMAATGRLRPLLARLRDPQLLRHVIVASLVLTANWTTYVWAVVHGRVIETALGYFITPIGLMVAGVFVLHETLHAVQRAALALAVVAVVVLTIGYGEVPWVSLIIASTWVIYSYIKKQSPLSATESLTAETLVLFLPAVALVLFEITRSNSAPHTASAGDWVLIALTGLVTAVPLIMFAMAAQRLPLTVMALVQYIVPTINFLLGWLAYDEHLDAVRVSGFVLVWIGLAAVSVDSVRRARRDAAWRDVASRENA
jgi:chloramphenicol-sensitive protein RarD